MENTNRVTRKDVRIWAKKARLDLSDQWEKIQQQLQQQPKTSMIMVDNEASPHPSMVQQRLLVACIGLAVIIILGGFLVSGLLGQWLWPSNSNHAAYTTISAPLEFASLQDFIKARNDKKAAATQPTDLSFDMQKLIAADKLFRINSFSDLMKEAEITINSDYAMIHYNYDNPDKELVTTMSDDPEMLKEILLSVILNWHRDQGEEAFNAHLSWNGKNGTVVSIGKHNKVLVLVGYYKEKLVLKSFEFLFNGNYLSLQVPGNVDDIYVGKIFDHIEEIRLD